jgi:hypothetical protein
LVTAAFFIPFGSDLALVWVVSIGMTGPFFYIIPCVTGTMDLWYGYWFMGWAGTHLANARKAKALISDFKTDGFPVLVQDALEDIKLLVLRFWTWLTDHIEGQINPKNKFRNRLRDMFLGAVRRSPRVLVYLIIFAMPMVPKIGIYLGVAACKALKFPGGMAVLTVGNILKVALWCALAHAAFG